MSATLAEFDEKADEIPAGAGYGAKDLKQLPDGDYSFEINTAQLKESKEGQHFFKLELDVFDGDHAGTTVEQLHFLTKKGEGLNEVALGILRKDLKTLGFDEAEWKKPAGRPFFGELTKAALIMPGVRFKGKKVTNKGYANLYVNERLADGKPEKFGPAELNAAAKANEAPFDV